MLELGREPTYVTRDSPKTLGLQAEETAAQSVGRLTTGGHLHSSVSTLPVSLALHGPSPMDGLVTIS